jgi:sulfite oxidase
MNGQPLPRDHGFPLRAIVPGHVAARSVKWLKHITLSDEESSSQWQRRDYKCFGPNQTEVDWDAAPAIQELPVQSAITTVKLGEWKQKPQESANRAPESGSKKASDTSASVRPVTMSGYAYSGGGRAIIRVDVSLDDGKSWTQAQLLPDCQSEGASSDNKAETSCLGHGAWSWKRWRFDGDVPLSTFTQQDDKNTQEKQDAEQKDSPTGASTNARSCTTLVVKATDESYNTQPESHSATWNIRGNLATAWHRVKICADCSPGALNEPPKKD